MIKPTTINILGKTYRVQYCDNQNSVDPSGHEALWGQIDMRTKTIRIYDSGRDTGDIFETILHEVLHGIADELKIEIFEDDKGHAALSNIAVALADVLVRNHWVSHDIKDRNIHAQ